MTQVEELFYPVDYTGVIIRQFAFIFSQWLAI
jgi:hypothetical protein